MRNIKFRSSDATQAQFAATVRRKVDNYFKEKAISPKGNWEIKLKSATMFAIYLLPFVLLLAVPMSGWLALLPVVLMGIGKAGIGMGIMQRGGNAFDAAAAVGAMAGLAEPEMNGIGGNGFMTIYHKASGKVWSLSMAGAAPKALVPGEMTPETLNAGITAGIVPGNLGGYLSQLQRFGTMSLAEVFAPAIEYAEKGYPIDAMLAQSIARGRNNLAKHPTSARIYLPNGEPLRAEASTRDVARAILDVLREAQLEGGAA